MMIVPATPMRTSAMEKLAFSAAITMSQADTMPVPPPKQAPCTSAIVGTGIVSACDIVIAAENATFSIAEVRIGVAGTIIIPQLNDAMSLRQVRRYALTGERFDAQEARRIGLVHEVVPLTELEARGERIVHELLTNGPDAVALTKIWALRSGWSHLDERAFGELVDAHAAKRQSEEAAEGFAAFREKRRPRWAPETKR